MQWPRLSKWHTVAFHSLKGTASISLPNCCCLAAADQLYLLEFYTKITSFNNSRVFKFLVPKANLTEDCSIQDSLSQCQQGHN